MVCHIFEVKLQPRKNNQNQVFPLPIVWTAVHHSGRLQCCWTKKLTVEVVAIEQKGPETNIVAHVIIFEYGYTATCFPTPAHFAPTQKGYNQSLLAGFAKQQFIYLRGKLSLLFINSTFLKEMEFLHHSLKMAAILKRMHTDALDPCPDSFSGSRRTFVQNLTF